MAEIDRAYLQSVIKVEVQNKPCLQGEEFEVLANVDPAPIGSSALTT